MKPVDTLSKKAGLRNTATREASVAVAIAVGVRVGVEAAREIKGAGRTSAALGRASQRATRGAHRAVHFSRGRKKCVERLQQEHGRREVHGVGRKATGARVQGKIPRQSHDFFLDYAPYHHGMVDDHHGMVDDGKSPLQASKQANLKLCREVDAVDSIGVSRAGVTLEFALPAEGKGFDDFPAGPSVKELRETTYCTL